VLGVSDKGPSPREQSFRLGYLALGVIGILAVIRGFILGFVGYIGHEELTLRNGIVFYICGFFISVFSLAHFIQSFL